MWQTGETRPPNPDPPPSKCINTPHLLFYTFIQKGKCATYGWSAYLHRYNINFDKLYVNFGLYKPLFKATASNILQYMRGKCMQLDTLHSYSGLICSYRVFNKHYTEFGFFLKALIKGEPDQKMIYHNFINVLILHKHWN